MICDLIDQGLTGYQAECVSAVRSTQSYTEAAELLNRPVSCVSEAVKRALERCPNLSVPRKMVGRRKATFKPRVYAASQVGKDGFDFRNH